MKKIAFIFLILIGSVVNAQRPLSKQAIRDLAAVCWSNYRFGNSMFIASMNTYMGVPVSEVAEIMENIETRKEGREKVLQVFSRISSGIYETIFQNLYSIQIPANECREIAQYIVDKNKNNSWGIDPKKQSLPDGTTSFDDDYNTYRREVTVKGNKITVKIFPTASKANFVTPVDQPLGTEVGFIKDGKIFIKDGKKYDTKRYYIENGRFMVNYRTGE